MKSSSANSNRCRIKVCGIRDPGEAAALDAMGVDWIGFNFHPRSARYLAPEAAAPMVRALKHAVPVGVFVDLDPAEVLRIIALTGIRCVQLHGREDKAYIAKMPLPVIKAIPHDRLSDLAGLADPNALEGPKGLAPGVSPLAYFLIDTQAAPSAQAGFGGSGRTFDWGLLAKHPLPLPYFLAGGLGPQNLAEALEACAAFPPFAVDLNSKVEVAPGRKDLGKVQAAMDIVRNRIA